MTEVYTLPQNDDTRCKLLLTKINPDTQLSSIKSAFSRFGNILNIKNKDNERSFTITFESPPDFRRIVATKPKVDGKDVFIRPFMDKKRMIYAEPKDPKYNSKTCAEKTFNIENELVWIFQDKPNKPLQILFKSEEAVQKILENKQKYQNFSIKGYQDLVNQRTQAKTNGFNVYINYIPNSITENEIKAFFSSFGKFSKFRIEKKVSFMTAQCQFDSKESAIKCINNRTIKMQKTFLPKVEFYNQEKTHNSLTLENQKPKEIIKIDITPHSWTGESFDNLPAILDRHKVVGDLREIFIEMYNSDKDQFKHSKNLFADLCNCISPDFQQKLEDITSKFTDPDALIEQENSLADTI